MAREKKCLYSALAPLHFLCRVFGVAPYSLHATKSRRKLYKSEFSDVLLSLAPTGIFFACFFLGLKDCSYEFYNILPAITAISQRYANVAIGVTNFACAYLHRRNIIKAVAVLSSTDNLLRRHSPVLSYRNCLRRVLLVIAVGLILNSVMLSMDLYKVLAEESRYFCMLLYSCSYTTTIVVECQMGILLMEIKKRFQVLNGAVEELTEELNERIFTENFQLLRYFGDSSRKLICYSKLHRKLCHVSELTSESFQAQVVVKILIAFVYIMSSLFFLFINMRIEPDIFQYFDAFLAFVYWSLLNFLEVTFIIYVHTSLAKEASNTVNILYKTNFKVINKDVKATIEMFSSQLYFYKIDFTACKLYPLNWETFFSILTGIFTYLIILIQFADISLSQYVNFTSTHHANYSNV